MTDQFQTEEYQKFVASMAEHCRCDYHLRPCDGVLAGGPCDGIRERDEHYCDDHHDE